MTSHLARAAALIAVVALVLAGCSSPSPATTPNPAGTTAPVAATTAGGPTTAPVAGEPCSFLTAAEVGAVLGSVPVEVKERAGRGDCDYWLTADKASKANVGVTFGPDGVSVFESTKGLGSPEPVDLGDDAYVVFNESLGAIVVVKKGDAVASIQVFTDADDDKQVVFAIALAKLVVAKL